MKKFLTLLLALVMALSIVGCGKTEDQTDDKDTPDEGGDAAVTVMTHAEFDAAASGEVFDDGLLVATEGAVTEDALEDFVCGRGHCEGGFRRNGGVMRGGGRHYP